MLPCSHDRQSEAAPIDLLHVYASMVVARRIIRQDQLDDGWDQISMTIQYLWESGLEKKRENLRIENGQHQISSFFQKKPNFFLAFRQTHKSTP